MSDATDRAIGEAVTSMFPDDIVARWLLITETIDPESGRRATVTLISDGMQSWETMGLAQLVIARETAGFFRDAAADDD